MNQRRGVLMWGLVLVIATAAGCSGRTTTLTELQRVRSGMLEVVVLSPHEVLRHGKDDFIVEFRTADGKLVDVGNVRAAASMTMSGTPMFGSVEVRRTDVAGRYAASGQLDMAGTWRITIEWGESGGKQSVTFSGAVQ
jgi:hypothetical protein